MVTGRWVWGLLGSAVIFSGTNIAIAQEQFVLPILLTQNTPKTEADLLFDEGDSFFEQGTAEGYQTAISKWQTALTLYEQQQNDEKIALTNLALGFLHNNLGYQQQALSYYKDSFAAYQKVGDRSGEAANLNNIGGVYNDLGDKEEALNYYQQALPLFRVVGDQSGEVTTLNNIGKAYHALGKKEEALNYYQQTLLLFQVIGEQADEATTLNNIGRVHDDLGEKQQAFNYYQQALVLFRAVGAHSGEADTLNNIGAVYSDLGKQKEALDYFQQALRLSQAVGDQFDEAYTLNNIGSVYSDLGEKEEALDYFQQALLLSRAVGNHSDEATTLNNIGSVYSDLGEKEKALDYYKQALQLSRTMNDRSSEAIHLMNIGTVYSDLGEQQQAFNYYQQALPLLRAVSNYSGEASMLGNISKIYFSNGESLQALEYLQQIILVFKAVGDRSSEATTLNNIGLVYFDMGDQEEALEYYQQALPLFQAVGDRSGEAITLNNLGLALQNDQPELAIIFYKQSVNVFESLRHDIKGLDQDIQETYLMTVESTYRRLADLLIQENRVLEAVRVLDLLKVQELNDLFGDIQVRSGSDDLGIFKLSAEKEFLDRYNAELRAEINLSDELQELINFEITVGLTETQLTRRRELERNNKSQTIFLQTFLNQPEIQELLNILKNSFALTDQDPTIDLNQRQDITEILQNLQQQGQQAAFLYPFILEDSLQLILITPNAAISRSVDISNVELNRRILAANAMLKDRTNLNSTDYSALEDLHAVLIEPIEAALDEAEIKTLIYAPDKALRYIPLAALRNKTESNWLIDKYRVNNITAQELTTLGRQSSKPLKVLAGAFTSGQHDITVEVSDGNNQGLKTEFFTGLTYAKKEIEEIAKVANTTTFLDTDFSKNVIQDFNGSTVIHFATHAKFLPQTPLDSFLVFGNGEHLTLRQMAEQHLMTGNQALSIDERWELNQQQLVVLSACETALGTDFNPAQLKEPNSGIEILGLGYQWQRQGARATMASLWQVQDASTQVLMTEFYQRLSTGEMSNIEAIRQAQLTLSQSEKYSHPHHWASFVLIGNGL